MRSRRRNRLIAAIVALLLILGLLSVAYVNYRATRKLSLTLGSSTVSDQIPPEYLFSFSGPTGDPIKRPLGVLVDSNKVFVTDSVRQVVDVYDLTGRRTATWGKGVLKTPLYIAKNPKTGDYWVSDRRTRGIHVFTAAGVSKGTFKPNLPKSELPKFSTGGTEWAPVGLAFAPDGSLYVTELLKGHRLLIFGPDGKFKRSVGDAGFVESAEDDPEIFQFPNGVKVKGNEVWVADSNNRRMQVFDLTGKFIKIVPTQGLPRGFTFLNPFRGEKTGTPAKFVVVDTLSHDATIWDVGGRRLVNFGGSGPLAGQFSYPNDIAAAPRNKLYVADTMNGRIDVWGWPAEAQPVPTPRTSGQWALCLTPLLLLPLLLLFRRRRFMATPDFVDLAVAAGEIDQLPARRRRWIAHVSHMDQIAEITLEDGRSVLEVFEIEGVESSDSDANELVDKLELTIEDARIMALAKRVPVLCTENTEYRRYAKLLELDVYNLGEFLAKFASGGRIKDERPVE